MQFSNLNQYTIGRVVTPEEYRDNIAHDVSQYVKKEGKMKYLNTHHARYLMNVNYPHIVCEVVTDNEGNPFCDVDVDGVRGTFVSVVLINTLTNVRTAVLHHPVMSNTKGAFKPAAIEADARAISDSITRAFVKLVGYEVGYGYNLWLQLELDEMDELTGESDDEEDDEVPTRSRRTNGRRKADVRPRDEDEDDEDDDDEYDDDDDEEDDDEEPAPVRTPRRVPGRATRTSSRRK